MAGKNSTVRHKKDAAQADYLNDATIYRLRRDALMIVSNMNRGGQAISAEKMKRQLVFVQGQLCTAAVADPSISDDLRERLIAFQCATITENIQDRRGARRRQSTQAQAQGGW